MSRSLACLLCQRVTDLTHYHVCIETQLPGEFPVASRVVNAGLTVCGRCYPTITRMGLLRVEETEDGNADRR